MSLVLGMLLNTVAVAAVAAVVAVVVEVLVGGGVTRVPVVHPLEVAWWMTVGVWVGGREAMPPPSPPSLHRTPPPFTAVGGNPSGSAPYTLGSGPVG